MNFKKILGIFTIGALVLLTACNAEPDLSTAVGRLNHEGESTSSRIVRVNQFADDLTEDHINEVLDPLVEEGFFEYETYIRQAGEGLFDFGIVVSLVDEDLIEAVNLAIEGDSEGLNEFRALIEIFELFARVFDDYNGLYNIRVFSPEVEEMLFVVFAPQASRVIIDLEE